MQTGLLPIRPDRRDFHFLKSFGATAFDTASLPANFSIYGKQAIPNQNAQDTRFSPPLMPLPEGCTAESGTFSCSLEDGALYNPLYTYEKTPPYINGTGRDIRDMLKSLVNDGLQAVDNSVGNNRKAYFNVYAAGAIDDFDAARIAMWINQNEKRAVILGSYWYPEFEQPNANGILPLPSFRTQNATLHCYIITGWTTINGQTYLEAITWQGENYGMSGIVYISRGLYNALINQTNTGAFTVTKETIEQPITLGIQANIDNLVAFIRQLFKIDPMSGVYPPIYAAAKASLGKHLTLDPSVPSEEGCAEALSKILSLAGYAMPPEGIAGVLALRKWMESHNFIEIATPQVGAIVSSRNADGSYAHIGVCMKYGIASNNSFGGVTGLFTENYSFNGWINSFVTLHGCDLKYHIPA